MIHIFVFLLIVGMDSFLRFFKKQIDALIYGLIGPFSILYLFPRFCLDAEARLGINLAVISVFKYLGIILMNLGLFIALWSALQMYRTKKASPSPFTLPQKIIKNGLFGIVRHPMMWALHFVLIGQVLLYHSPLILLWFVLWCRFSYVYIERYEEPYLVSVFGKAYIDYCKATPRWIPKVFGVNKRK